MADEITLTAKLLFQKGDIDVDLEMVAQSFTVAGTEYIKQSQTIGTSAEAIYLGDTGKGGYLLGINRDATNFMQIIGDATDSTYLIRLEPGDVCLFRVDDGATPAALADTAAVQFEYLLIEA